MDVDSALLWVLVIFLGCGGFGDPMPVGGKAQTVATDCPEPYRRWIGQEAKEFGWELGDWGEWSVYCGDTGPGGGVEVYKLRTSYITFDPNKVGGFPEFGTMAAVGHGWVHLLVDHGPRPELAPFHVCDWPINERPPPDCYPGESAPNVLMSPGGLKEWDGDQGGYHFGGIPEYRVTRVDREFVQWATEP